MKYPFMVKFNGKYYPSGAEVPTDAKVTEKKEQVKVEPKEEPKVEEPKEEPVAEYTRTDINRMSTSDLQAFGKRLNVKDAETMSGSQLKKIIPDILGI